jgi:hypothetical protein
MEKVKVVRDIPGILKVGDILVSSFPQDDFVLSETEINRNGENERYVSFDYVTISENVPTFFEFETEDIQTIEVEDCCGCYDCDCIMNEGVSAGNEMASPKEVIDRYNFFSEQFDNAAPGSEAQVVYRNLMWFIEWMFGERKLINA